MFCNRCGAKLPEGAKFCHNCGSAAYNGAESTVKKETRDTQVHHLPSPKKALAIVLATVVVIAAGILAFKPGDKSVDTKPNKGTSIAQPSAVIPQKPAASEEPQTADSAPDLNKTVNTILNGIEMLDGFVAPDKFYQPLANITDVDGNGVYELFLLYRINDGGRFRVDYSVWSIDGGGYSALRTATLYDEVGGNSGYIVPVVDRGGNPYLLTVSRSPQGENFNDTYIYLPWNREQTALTDAWIYMEGHGTYGQEDKGWYILGDKRADKDDFDSRQADFTCYWSELNLNKGPDGGGGSLSFEQVREMDLSTKIFFSPN